MNIINEYFKVTFFGESHGKLMGFTVDNYPAGIKIDLTEISRNLSLRRGNEYTTSRKEEDEFEIVSGYFNGYTTGASLTVVVKNKDYDDSVYHSGLFRPSTSDYVAYQKYGGFNDFNGSGIFSARLTVLYVILGTIFKMLLPKEILVASHVSRVYDIVDTNFDKVSKEESLMELLQTEKIPFIDKSKLKEVEKLLVETSYNYGSSVETKIIGLDGLFLGEPLAYSFESALAKLIFQIPGVKALEFGIGVDYSKSNDLVNDVYLKSNNEGGINAGITNGMPVIFKTHFRPIPSTSREQSFYTKEGTYEISNTKGRHDRVIALRATVIINMLCYTLLADLIYLGGKNGSLNGIKKGN